ncbi:Lysine exporter protein (LYSE/YGGA) [Solidesulfovibrio fructosivorans JJ]]|uniref:Lysine exporter protein (LYSE/YGGA) n=1 Tax=Solidesulfovibrio fructosivorans JJ] TaxID=596151 RepID=E1JTX3_SOLFR|nr:LysE family translocator [Solidesulfovibrio fructosivorans]EFL52252.1 Lysine exporter protein (LYSE/YGGA) [Solidesulfovibrio fructosivorans JJ]]
MTLPLYLAFIAAASVLLVFPGPTVLMVIGYGLAEGRKSVWSLVTGVCLGDAVACAGSLAGLGALLSASAAAFTVVKVVGAVYLVWLGIGMLRSGNDAVASPAPCPAGRKFVHAFTVTVLNPKTILFFVAFLPQFVSPQAPALPQLALLGTTFVLLGAANTTAYALLAGTIGGRIRDPRFVGTLRRVGGGSLIGAGVLTAVAVKR